MTQQKKLKKAIRARSQKTGESYTAARRQFLAGREKPVPEQAAVLEALPEVPAETAPSRPSSPTKGGISEKSVLEKTGHSLDHWFGVLDASGMADKGHTAIAAYLYNEHKVPGWYSQGITVAYERARGLREMNQACSGKFQVSVTKTVPATVAEVVEALTNPERRAAWLEGSDPSLHQALEAAFTGKKPREVKTKGSDTAWLRYPWDASRIEIRVTGKPNGKASIIADNQNLTNSAQVEERRAQWRTVLDSLNQHLGG